ncbi:hypothetical protein HOLleu_35153 [Holothuria leucospilota]|uniref:Protein quiver n=1 Tax=Holothuria leucospilota TaxID=206669 RepID=A0A9Q1BFW3_HOLLE|nr:hypothetical protein HOLleu_35153 [Holothuria leucospilota]
MALTGTSFLAICMALLLTVHGLKCYDKTENKCTGNERICDTLSSDKELTEATCDDGVTMCSLMTFKKAAGLAALGAGYEIETVKAECLPAETDTTLTSDCYGREKLRDINPDEEDVLTSYERNPLNTVKSLEICICKGDLCNGSIKSVFSISVIISSVVMSFVLFS